ncbi:MAG: hypothetical protein AAFV53_17875 [Myxococcota bacterium]
MPHTTTASLLKMLGEAGGIASVSHLAARVGPALSRRQIRDHLKARPAVRYLGAGYFALENAPFAPVVEWTEAWLSRAGTTPIETVVAAVLEEYPRGDSESVRRWLRQEPGRLQVEPGDMVRVLPQRWRRRT